MNFLADQAKSLEDAFFFERDKILKEQFKRLQQMKETKEALSEASGIKNEKILQKLVELNVQPDILAALTVVPIIEVAWADGQIDQKERQAIGIQIEEAGINRDSAEFKLIDQWLTHKPEQALLNAWVHYIEGLCESLSSDERTILKQELLGKVRAVANASGGLLGMGNKISKKESEMIFQLERAFPR